MRQEPVAEEKRVGPPAKFFFRRFALKAILAGLASQLGLANADDAPGRTAALAVLHQRFPERFVDPGTLVFGDFDGDGRTDFAAFLGDPNGNDPDRILEAVVFRAMAADEFVFLGSTRGLPSGGNVTQMLSTKSGVLNVERGGSDCCCVWNELLKFRWRNNQLHLVGIEQSSVSSGERRDDKGRSINMITGEVLAWSLTGSHRQELRCRHPPPDVDFDYGRVMDRIE